MDKKNTVIGVLLIAAALVAIILTPKPAPVSAPAPVATAPAATTGTATTTPGSTSATQANGAATATPGAAPVVNTAFAAIARDDAAANVTTLSNDFIEVHFTDFGGAVRDVAFTKRDQRDRLVYAAELNSKDPFVFNSAHADPMLAFVDFPGLDRHVRYNRVSQTTTEVVYQTVLDGRLEVTRRYVLAPNAAPGSDPYQLRHETTFRNLTAQVAPMPLVALSIGTAAPTGARDLGTQLTTGFSTGKDQTFIVRHQLEGGNGFLGIGASEQKAQIVSSGAALWTTVSNQFFATILTPDEPASGLVTRRVKLLPLLPDTDLHAYGITGTTQFTLKPIAANGEIKLGGNFYVGPKEYKRLGNASVFKAEQRLVMQYGFWKFFSALLVTLMGWMHALVPNWGVAIILSTLSLKLIFLPLTIKASRSMKRMAKLQPLITALRDKYKDNPQKQQTAMMELYKEHKVNPLGGCLPMLIPFPFFIGFFSMLQSTAELRFAPFLWAHDLSSTDTIGYLWGLSINVLPIVLTISTFVQMRLTPTPTVDNAQAKMMQFMPLIFLFFYYSMPAALSLYSTTNAVFTILQQIVINRMKEPDETAPAPLGGKPVKNVTPKKK